MAFSANTTSIVISKGPEFLLLATWAISRISGMAQTLTYSIGNISRGSTSSTTWKAH
jgi:hypothetical protein